MASSSPALARHRSWLIVGLSVGLLGGGCGDGRRPAAAVRATTATTGDANMMPVTNAACVRTIERLDLSARTELILARERGGFDSMLEVLRGDGGKGGGEVDPSPPSVAELDAAMRSAEPSKQYAAAFLAGRCRTSTAADATLTETLRQVMDDQATPADAAIEAAMALVLRGEPERGHGYLRRAAAKPDPFADPYKAAFFLAQLGDTSGWPAMVRTLASDVPHYRLMALRHLAGFLPFDGQDGDGVAIDVAARLRAGLADPDPMVRQEMPFYLEEARAPGLVELLGPVATGDPDPSVRTAARMVLDRLPATR